MGIACDYFSASSDDAAAQFVGSGPVDGSIDGNGIDPIVQMATLEEELTGRNADEIIDAEANNVVAEQHDGEVIVVRLSESLVAAMVASSEQKLLAAVVPWSQTDEFAHWQDRAGDIARFLEELSRLAVQAVEKRETLYCRVSV